MTAAGTTDNAMSSGKKWSIAVLIVLLIAALASGGYLLATKKKAGAEASGEVFLTAASTQGQDPFSDVSFAAPTDTSIAPAATGAQPASQAASVTANPGGQSGLYGGRQGRVACDADKMVDYLQRDPSRAAAWASAVNADPNLNWFGGTVTAQNIQQYMASLTPVFLVKDTRVTSSGRNNGKVSTSQVILQKGTAVFVDGNGVPRIRCSSSSPLRAPKATKSAPKYAGKSWPGFAVNQLGVVSPNATRIKKFQVRVPAKPGGAVKAQAVGPFACVLAGTPCVTPSGVRKKSATGVPGTNSSPFSTSPAARKSSSAPRTSAPATTSAPRTSSAPTTKAPSSSTAHPLSTKKGNIGFVSQPQSDGYTIYRLQFSGYSSNSTVQFVCHNSDGDKGPYSSTMDSSGNNSSGAFCRDKTGAHLSVTDHLNQTFNA